MHCRQGYVCATGLMGVPGLRTPSKAFPSCRGGPRARAATGIKAKGRSQEAEKAVDALMHAIAASDRGLNSSAVSQIEIQGLVKQLETIGRGQLTTGQSLSATWKLVWTTEKETLFILEKAGLFGTTAGDVFQVIDVSGGSLQNVITFPPDGAFIVSSSLRPAGEQRMEFKFSSAKLKLPAFDVPFPPFGQGWFESVYLDDEVRVARDIRGDTLVVVRDGAPRVFE